jgi:hypothetical protein
MLRRSPSLSLSLLLLNARTSAEKSARRSAVRSAPLHPRRRSVMSLPHGEAPETRSFHLDVVASAVTVVLLATRLPSVPLLLVSGNSPDARVVVASAEVVVEPVAAQVVLVSDIKMPKRTSRLLTRRPETSSTCWARLTSKFTASTEPPVRCRSRKPQQAVFLVLSCI